MPFGSEGVQPGIGLALSGGGFRATLFHCGALCRLDELGVLSRADRISSVSGGSITAGLLAVRWKALRFHGEVAPNLRELVIEPLQTFCHRTIDTPAIGLGVLLPGRRPSDLLEAAYAEHLYGSATLQELSDRPRFVFNATNLATGVSFRFSKPYAGDKPVPGTPQANPDRRLPARRPEGRVLGHRHRHPQLRARRRPAGAGRPHPGACRDANAAERFLRCGTGRAHQLGVRRV